jgi:hypothetical protein
MKFQQYLQEEYFGRGKKFKGTYEVFLNPSRKEFRDAENESKLGETQGFIRLIIDRKNHNLYVASGRALHDEIAEVVDKENGTNYAEDYDEHYFPLVGNFDGNILYLKESSMTSFDREELEEIMKVMEDKTSFVIKWSGR